MKMNWPSDRTCKQHSNTKKLKGREGEYLEIPAYYTRELPEGKGEMTI